MMQIREFRTITWEQVGGNIRLSSPEFPGLIVEFPAPFPTPGSNLTGISREEAQNIRDTLQSQRVEKIKKNLKFLINKGINEILDASVHPENYVQCQECKRFTKKSRKDQVFCAFHMSSKYRLKKFRGNLTPGEKEKNQERDRLRKKTQREIEKEARKHYATFKKRITLSAKEGGVVDPTAEAERIREICHRINREAGSPLSEKVIQRILKEIDGDFFNSSKGENNG